MRRLAWVLGAVLVAALIPIQAYADPSVPPGQPVKCLTNTQKGKQVLVPCDLLNAGANYPPGQRCPPPIEQYPKDVADWCGDGPGLASPAPTSPTTPTSGPPSPTGGAASPTSPTSSATPTTTASPATQTNPAPGNTR